MEKFNSSIIFIIWNLNDNIENQKKHLQMIITIYAIKDFQKNLNSAHAILWK